MKLEISNSISAASGTGGTVTTPTSVTHTGTGAGVSGTTSGGVTNTSNDPDLPEAAKATLTVNLSGAASNTGFQFNSINFRILDSGETGEGTVDRTLTKGQTSSGYTNYFSYQFDGNNITFTARNNGASYNGYSISNSYKYSTPGEPVITDYTAYSGFTGAIETITPAVSSVSASWTLDLSGMTVDDFSQAYSGQTLQFNSSTYKFYDSGRAPELVGFAEDGGSRTVARTQIDINDIRQSVNNGQTLAAALKAKLSNSYVQVDGNNVKFISNYSGASGNGRTVTFTQETLRHYDIDFSSINAAIPNDLYSVEKNPPHGAGDFFICKNISQLLSLRRGN